MALVQITFSPTGGTGKVADIIAKEWEVPITRVDLSDAKTDFSKIKLDQGDVALIAVPSYGGRVPELAAKRLMKINGNQARGVIVCVYGNRAYEDTLIELRDIVESCGLCAENCPAQAISRDNLKTADSKKCISCMRCVAGCPKSARKVNGALVSAAALAIKKACSERKEAELFY